MKIKQSIANDLAASLVVFLVALPLCLGIAIASGTPPARGLITGIVGGIVVGAISGSPLQVSGPAAGLAVIIVQFIQTYGIEMLGPILLLAGLIQLIAGIFKLGQTFRAISPAVIYGMLAGIGVLIFASQFHVMIDDKPHEKGLENLLLIPGAIYKVIFPTDSSTHQAAAIIALITIITLILWDRFRPKSLKLLPGALVAVVLATTITTTMKLPIQVIDVPANIAETIQVPTLPDLGRVFRAPLLLEALTIAFIASAESLLSAAAVDRLQQEHKTDFDRELAAQGLGNMVCGALGALPMTGVIARSSVNVEAGAKTRLSTILHGVWLLLIVATASTVLRLVPKASLAAILVVTGYKLVKVEKIRKLKQYGRFPLIIYFVTLVGVVAIDLLTGVLLGVGLTTARVIYKLSRLDLYLEQDEQNQRIDLYLEGAATFIQLPKLSATLDQIPPKTELHLHLEKLAYIDHSCLDLFSTWKQQQEHVGSSLVVQWDSLIKRFQRLTVP